MLAAQNQAAPGSTADRAHAEQRRGLHAQHRIADLERLAARNAAILQNAMDGFFVLGEDYRFQEVNDAFCRMTGYTAAELLQKLKMTDLEVARRPRMARRRTGAPACTTSPRRTGTRTATSSSSKAA